MGAWIEITLTVDTLSVTSRPRMGAWIEILPRQDKPVIFQSRPRMGAWIEMSIGAILPLPLTVAPVWGRGLKWGGCLPVIARPSRPRMGAWIEIEVTTGA